MPCHGKGKSKGKDRMFYGHMTHESIQSNEESVKYSGDGFHDSPYPKSAKTDKFYDDCAGH